MRGCCGGTCAKDSTRRVAKRTGEPLRPPCAEDLIPSLCQGFCPNLIVPNYPRHTSTHTMLRDSGLRSSQRLAEARSERAQVKPMHALYRLGQSGPSVDQAHADSSHRPSASLRRVDWLILEHEFPHCSYSFRPGCFSVYGWCDRSESSDKALTELARRDSRLSPQPLFDTGRRDRGDPLSHTVGLVGRSGPCAPGLAPGPESSELNIPPRRRPTSGESEPLSRTHSARACPKVWPTRDGSLRTCRACAVGRCRAPSLSRPRPALPRSIALATGTPDSATNAQGPG